MVRVNAGGIDVRGHSPVLCFLQESFLAIERDNIFGEGVRITRNHIKQKMAGLVPLVCT